MSTPPVRSVALSPSRHETAGSPLRPEPAADLETLLLFAAPAAALASATLTPADVGRVVGPCFFHLLTGIPCPTCGVTRAVTALGHGDWLGALAVQPLITLIVTGLALYLPWAVAVVWRGWKPLRFELRGPRSLAIRVAIVAAVLGNWLYLIVAGV